MLIVVLWDVVSCDNCHSHVARCLDVMKYKGFSRWNMIILCFWVFFCGKTTLEFPDQPSFLLPIVYRQVYRFQRFLEVMGTLPYHICNYYDICICNEKDLRC